MKRTRFLFAALLGTACCWPGLAVAQQPGVQVGETVPPAVFSPEGTVHGGTVHGGVINGGTVQGGTVMEGSAPGAAGAVAGGVVADGDTVYGGPWHYGYYHTMWGRPVALVVPPQANYQTNYAWGVGNTTITPIYPQYAGPSYVPVAAPSPRPGYLPPPYWPSDTRQFGVYYIRAPW